jgi:hypothetical protein
MTTTRNIKKMAGTALLSGVIALTGLGLASGTAQAQKPMHCFIICDSDGCREQCFY